MEWIQAHYPHMAAVLTAIGWAVREYIRFKSSGLSGLIQEKGEISMFNMADIESGIVKIEELAERGKKALETINEVAKLIASAAPAGSELAAIAAAVEKVDESAQTIIAANPINL